MTAPAESVREQGRIPLPERLAYRPAEAAVALGVSRPTLYKLMRRADFPAINLGNRRLIPVDGLKRWLEAQVNGGVADD